MARSRRNKSVTRNSSQQCQPKRTTQRAKPTPSGREAGLEFLQRTAGNRAVNRSLLASTSQVGGAHSDSEIAVSQPGDAQEREADRVAEHVMRQVSSDTASTPTSETTPLQPKRVSQSTPALAALRGTGQPLPVADRTEFEAHLGHDLSDVRLHTDAQSAQLAESLNARAFTLGRDVVFGAGQHAPQSAAGKKLMAHELTHVVQQAQPGNRPAPGGIIMREVRQGNNELAGRLSLFGSHIPPPTVTRTESGTIGAVIYFGQNDSLLFGANFQAIERLSAELRFAFNATVTVDGHASAEGSDTLNQELSEKRRQAVMLLLGLHARTDIRTSGESHGESRPAVPEVAIDTNDLEKQRAQNRRVEMTIIPPLSFDQPKPSGSSRSNFFPPPIVPRPSAKPGGLRFDDIIPSPGPKRPGGSIAGELNKRMDTATEDVLDRFGIKPQWLRDLIKSGVRAGVAKGSSEVLDVVLDQAPLSPDGKRAFKKIVEGFVNFEFHF